MFPGGVNQRQMRMAMQKMGIQQEEVDAVEVIIRLQDREIVISNPQVARINMMGQKTYQVVGEEEERPLSGASAPEISEEDIQTVMEQAGVSHEVALDAIAGAEGDLAAAIMSLRKE